MRTHDNEALKSQLEDTPTWPPPLPAAISVDQTVMEVKAKSLTQALFSLDEPWRSRFLKLVANLATNWTWDGRAPTWEEVAAWLLDDLDLYREVRMLLDAWLRPRR